VRSFAYWEAPSMSLIAYHRSVMLNLQVILFMIYDEDNQARLKLPTRI
jgi:hypothetical protein